VAAAVEALALPEVMAAEVQAALVAQVFLAVLPDRQ
jgi:hypothetical protein